MLRSINLLGHHWWVERQGDGFPILWLHGFTGSHESWHRIIPAFAEHYTCVVPDILGHGGSDAPTTSHSYHMSALVDSLQMMMVEEGVPSFHVVGYSMGGRIALSLAARHPACVKKLVLESASPGIADPTEREARRQQDEALASWAVEQGIEAFVDRWERTPLFRTQETLARSILDNQRRIRLSHDINGLSGSLRGTGTGVQASLWSSLGEIKHPTLLITGELDDKFTDLNQRMASIMPEAVHTIVPDSGHTVHLEQPNAYVAAIQSFLA